jgi:hypothetical protein
MKLPIFQILNYTLILIVLILFIRYIWDMLFDRDYQPASWREARKRKELSRDLLRAERNYSDTVRFFSWWIQAEVFIKAIVPGPFIRWILAGNFIFLILSKDSGQPI